MLNAPKEEGGALSARRTKAELARSIRTRAASGKRFEEMLNEALGSNLKVVVFTQYLGMMDMIGEFLKGKGVGYTELRGDTTDRARAPAQVRHRPELQGFRLLAACGRTRYRSDRWQRLHPHGPLVESRQGKPGHRPLAPHRPDPRRAGLQAADPGHRSRTASLASSSPSSRSRTLSSKSRRRAQGLLAQGAARAPQPQYRLGRGRRTKRMRRPIASRAKRRRLAPKSGHWADWPSCYDVVRHGKTQLVRDPEIHEFPVPDFGAFSHHPGHAAPRRGPGWRIYEIKKDPLYLGLIGSDGSRPERSRSALFGGHAVDRGQPLKIYRRAVTAAMLASLGAALRMRRFFRRDPDSKVLVIFSVSSPFGGDPGVRLAGHVRADSADRRCASGSRSRQTWMSAIFQVGAISGPAIAGRSMRGRVRRGLRVHQRP